MLLFAHTGLTLGLFALTRRIISPVFFSGKKSVSNKPTEANSLFIQAKPSHPWPIDYRIVLLGSMFPDIIDKPLGMLFFPHLLGAGRIYAHTLLVNAVLVLIGIFLLKKKRGFLVFSLASCFHLVLDQMWLTPKTLLWPLYGWRFPPSDIPHWWQNMFQALFSNPLVYLPEIMGLVILIIFGLRLLKKRMLFKFLSEGITRMPQASIKPG